LTITRLPDPEAPLPTPTKPATAETKPVLPLSKDKKVNAESVARLKGMLAEEQMVLRGGCSEDGCCAPYIMGCFYCYMDGM
jgi:hypothetical protein